MSKLPIIIAPDERLTTRASEVTSISDRVEKLVIDMFETMYHAGGIGLAAVQVGVLKRIFVVDVGLENIEVGQDEYKPHGKFCMINPEILELSDEKTSIREGCLSIPEQGYEIKRPRYLTIKYKNLNNEEQTLKAIGSLARCIQHELDHLDGILYIKHLSKLKYNFSIKRAQKIKKRYELSNNLNY